MLPSMPESVCKTCLVDHDDEIHAATERLHNWLRHIVQERLRELERREAEAA